MNYAIPTADDICNGGDDMNDRRSRYPDVDTNPMPYRAIELARADRRAKKSRDISRWGRSAQRAYNQERDRKAC